MNDERPTPRELFNPIDREFHFTVDAAATAENALVNYIWTIADNALRQNWSGHRVWCNPPYSRQQIIRWVEKALASPATTVMLVPGDSSTIASQRMLAAATAILFLDRRIKFDHEKAGAKFPSWLVLFNGIAADLARLHRLKLGFVAAFPKRYPRGPKYDHRQIELYAAEGRSDVAQ
jgi:site-specific DNA-methyltransferase (adenine-specific)